MISNEFRGEFAVEVNGKMMNGAFTLNAIRLFIKKNNIKFSELQKVIQEDPLTSIPEMAYFGVISEASKKGTKLKLDEETFIACVLDDSKNFEKISDALTKAFDTQDDDDVSVKGGN